MHALGDGVQPFCKPEKQKSRKAVSRSCGSFQMKQLTIFHQSEGLASSSNSVELAIETKGTTDAGTAAVQRHSDRCEPLKSKQKHGVETSPMSVSQQLHPSDLCLFLGTTKQQLEATLLDQLLPLKTESSWEKPEAFAAVAKKLPEAAKAAEVLVEWRVWGHSAPQRRGKKHTQSLSALHPTTQKTPVAGVPFFPTKKSWPTNLCFATKGELRDFTFASHAMPSHHRNTPNHHPASQENCRTSAPI